jgi:hypothetical protein
MQSESERASRSSENGANGSSDSPASAAGSGGTRASHEGEETGAETEGAAQPIRARIGSLQWWAAVVLYSVIVAALVIGFSSLSRLV